MANGAGARSNNHRKDRGSVLETYSGRKERLKVGWIGQDFWRLSENKTSVNNDFPYAVWDGRISSHTEDTYRQFKELSDAKIFAVQLRISGADIIAAVWDCEIKTWVRYYGLGDDQFSMKQFMEL